MQPSSSHMRSCQINRIAAVSSSPYRCGVHPAHLLPRCIIILSPPQPWYVFALAVLVHGRHRYFFPRFASRKRTCFRTAICQPPSSCLLSHPFLYRPPRHSSPISLYPSSSSSSPSTSFCTPSHARKETQGNRTNRIVLEHTKRLMGAWSLHGAVVARHGHGDEAHHYRAGLCCVVVLLAHACRYLEVGFWHCGGWWGRCAALEEDMGV